MKKIIITSCKLIPTKGVHGPVLSPYMESKKEICKMLAKGIEIEEILDNGEHRKLDIPTVLNDEDNHVEIKPTIVENKVDVKSSKQDVAIHYNEGNDSRKNKKDKKKNKNQKPAFEIDTFESK